MDLLDPALFKTMFRINHATFLEVLDKITPFMVVKNDTKARNSSGSPIALKSRLAVTLRWLAGASYLNLCFSFSIATATFYHPTKVLWPMLSAIDSAFKMGLLVDDIGKLEMPSNGFYEYSGGILDGCEMALDGFGI